MGFFKTSLIACALIVWVAALAGGFFALQHYSAKAGVMQNAGDQGRDFIALHRKPDRPLLVMAVHPRCPCTRASLGELGDLLAWSRGACDAVLLEYTPQQPDGDWPKSAPFCELGGVRVRVVPDPAGRIAAALGAQTSGHLVFADRSGAVRFEGGLTLSRGHRGRSPALDAALAMLRNEPSSLRSAAVYGCALQAECQANLSQ